MKKALLLALVLLFCLAACGEADMFDRYDMEGVHFIAFSDIDTVCEDPALAGAGSVFLSQMADTLLLSYVMDSSIVLEDELGDYDHLILTNPQWIERFGSPGNLEPVPYDSLPDKMRVFLEAQMPLLTADGQVLPDGIGLYRYQEGGLLAFPVNVTLGWAEPVEAENPLILLVDRPAEVLKPGSCLLPMASSGNVLFTGGEALQTAFAQSGLDAYGEVRELEEPAG